MKIIVLINQDVGHKKLTPTCYRKMQKKTKVSQTKRISRSKTLSSQLALNLVMRGLADFFQQD